MNIQRLFGNRGVGWLRTIIGAEFPSALEPAYRQDRNDFIFKLYRNALIPLWFGILIMVVVVENTFSIYHIADKKLFLELRVLFSLLPFGLLLSIRTTRFFERFHQYLFIAVIALGNIAQASVQIFIPFEEQTTTNIGFVLFFCMILGFLPIGKTILIGFFSALPFLVAWWNIKTTAVFTAQQIQTVKIYIFSQVFIGSILGLLAGLAFSVVYRSTFLAKYHLRQQREELEKALQELQTAEESRERMIIELQNTTNNLALVNHELYEMNEVMQQQNQKLVDAEQFRLNMLGIVSHDLKNPIQGIIGLSSVLLDNSEFDTRTKEIIHHIYESGERMNIMVMDLLDTAARESGLLEIFLQPAELFDITRGVLRHYEEALTRKEQKIIFEVSKKEYWAIVDVKRMVQVIDNIVSNAIKFSPIQKNIIVRLSEKNQSVRLEIQDEGPGISNDDMSKLFGEYERLSAQPTGGEHSTGLGLSIVKKMVEAMNGTVWCESELGKGATFIVELPIQTHKEN